MKTYKYTKGSLVIAQHDVCNYQRQFALNRQKNAMGATCARPIHGRFLMKIKKQDSQALYWNAPMVASFIALIGLKDYVQPFLVNGVDGPTLLTLRRDQFERCLGITDPMHWLSLRLGLDDLKEKVIDYTQWEWSCAGVSQWLTLRGLDQLTYRFSSAAVHGSVLFRLNKAEFAAKLHVGELGESELVLDSLMYAIDRARRVGYYPNSDNFLDWGTVEIKNWLDRLNLGHLEPIFRQHAVNGSLLPHLDHATLQRTMKLTEIQTIVVYKAIKRLGKKTKQKERVNSFQI